MMADTPHHHPICASETAEEERAFTLWKRQWPNACDSCDGQGGFAFGDRHVDPDSWLDCPSCVDRGQCPRCAGPKAFTDPACPQCGWTGRDPEDVAPAVTVCSGDCWDRYAENA